MNHDKGSRYINQLYAARCSSQWQAVPELARKVEKHAPTKKCLIAAARCVASIRTDPTHSLKSPSAQAHLETLSTAIANERGHTIESFEATTCKALLLNAAGQSQEGLALLEKYADFLRPPATCADTDQDIWCVICIINGCTARGAMQRALNDTAAAQKTYSGLLPFVTDIITHQLHSVELRRTIELFLSDSCFGLSSQSTQTSDETLSLLNVLRLLSKFDQNSTLKLPRRQIWFSHYKILSNAIADGLILTPSSVVSRRELDLDTRIRLSAEQYAELRQSEMQYERLLLQQTKFPKANETNEEVKVWIELVMKNWSILCGSSWTEGDIGRSKQGIGHKTLDILYRAATKTFHSTQLLRHLFTIHVFLGEFDLAFKAFDSYVELVTKGKARIEKSGDRNPDLDDDETALLLAVKAINVSCQYGTATAAEKALEIGSMIQKWIKHGDSKSSDQEINDGDEAKPEQRTKTPSEVSPKVLGSVYRAIGISQAQWSRYTYDVRKRELLQQTAIRNLNIALSFSAGQLEDIQTLYALSLLLGETRDIAGAVEMAKRALTPVNSDTDTVNLIPLARERCLIPIWHLLALLLTTQENFSVAEQSCEAAFSQFEDPSTLFGNESISEMGPEQSPPKLSASLIAEKSFSSAGKGLVDEMSSIEKRYILDIKMTQMLLLEIEEGPEIAVNTAHELLALYARLFGASSQRPSTAQSSVPLSVVTSAIHADTSLASRPGTSVTPTLSTTMARDINGVMNNPSKTVKTAPPENSTVISTPSVLKKTPSGKLRKSKEIIRTRSITAQEAIEKTAPVDSTDLSKISSTGHMELPSQWPLAPLSDEKHAVRKSGKEPQQFNIARDTIQSSFAQPTPVFPELLNLRIKTSILVKIWLFVASLYGKASMFEDGKEAVNEAKKLVALLESEISKKSSNIKAFQEHAFGSSQSLEEIWADVYCEQGNLLHAESSPYEAIESFEKALSHDPDHLLTIIGLSKILLDIYQQIIPPEKPVMSLNSPSGDDSSRLPTRAPSPLTKDEDGQEASKDPSPPQLNRLAARDRACGLLASATKLGAGWDNSEAWFVLARAYEESGQLEKAKEALWFTVELENSKPVRHWRNVNAGGYVL